MTGLMISPKAVDEVTGLKMIWDDWMTRCRVDTLTDLWGEQM